MRKWQNVHLPALGPTIDFPILEKHFALVSRSLCWKCLETREASYNGSKTFRCAEVLSPVFVSLVYVCSLANVIHLQPVMVAPGGNH